MKTKKKCIIISIVIILVLALTAVLTMPRFYTGDRIKLNIRISGADIDKLSFNAVNRQGEEQEYSAETKGDTVFVSVKGGDKMGYALQIEGTETPVAIYIRNFDWFQRTDSDIELKFDDDGVNYTAETSATSGEMPFREHRSTSGKAEMENGYLTIKI